MVKRLAARDRPADLALVDGNVVTMSDRQPTAEALAARDGTITAVGTTADVRPMIDAKTTVIDLRGDTVIPGINDSHAHVTAWGASRPPLALDISFPSVRSIADIAAAVGEAARRAQPGEWIRGVGWDPGYLAECTADSRRLPTRWDLDSVSPDNPVVLQDFSVHELWANSRAIEIAGITRETPSPPGGQILADEVSAEPTGLFRELSATELVQQHVPLLTRAERRQAVLAATADLHRLGVTSVTEPGLGPGGDRISGGALGADSARVYEELLRSGELDLRVTVLLLLGAQGTCTAEDIASGLESFEVSTTDPRWLRVGGVKIFADGIPPLKTAWLSEEYVDGGYGSLVIPGEDDESRCRQLAEMVRVAHEARHQVGVHATGDAAIDATVSGFVAAIERDARSDARHYVIHGGLASPETLRTMAQYGIGLNSQPQIKATIADLMDGLLGEERSSYQMPTRTAIDAGVRVAFSSDMPVAFPDWRQGVAAAVLRKSKASGKVSGPEQCVRVEEALRAYTVNGAWQDFAEDWKGSLEVGKAADLCVLGGNLLRLDPEEIPDVPITATIVDGHVVHRQER